jgi:hypothetical protein
VDSPPHPPILVGEPLLGRYRRGRHKPKLRTARARDDRERGPSLISPLTTADRSNSTATLEWLKEQTGLTPIEIDPIYQSIVIIDLTQPLD